MVYFTKKETSKRVKFGNLSIGDIFYDDEYYWMKTYPVRDYDSSSVYNAHTINEGGDCEFYLFDNDQLVITGETEIITTF